MDLVKVCSKALVVAKPKGTLGPNKKKITVLDEEKYTEVISMQGACFRIKHRFGQSKT